MRFIFKLFLVLIFISGCSSRSGQHHYWERGKSKDTFLAENNINPKDFQKFNPSAKPGEWVFIPSKIGILPFLQETEVVEDYSGLQSSKSWGWPVPGITKISSHFGDRWGRKHEGIDIPGPKGTKIVAVKDGIVKYSNSKISGYGNMIVIDHGEKIFSVYAHNQKNLVSQGEGVQKGQVIALLGNTGRSTGPHLHFEIRVGPTPKNPSGFLNLSTRMTNLRKKL